MIYPSLRYLIIILLGIFISTSQNYAYGSPKKQKTLLVINSYNEFAPWTREVTKPINYYVANDDNVRAEMFNMNNVLIQDTTLFNEVKASLFQIYNESRRPDYLVILGTLAFSMREEIKKNWGDIPMLLITRDLTLAPTELYMSGYDLPCINNTYPSLAELRPEYNFTAIYIPDFYKETINLMISLIPNMENFVFFSDNDYMNRYLSREIENYLTICHPEISYIWVKASYEENDEMQKYFINEMPNTGMLISSWLYARPGPFGYPNLVAGDLNLLATSLNPVFSLRKSYMDYGTVGGVYVNSEILQREIVDVLDKMVKGESMRSIRFCTNKKNEVTVLDYTKLIEYNLPIKNCPDSTEFIDKPLTVWEKYTWQIIGIGLLMLLGLFYFIRKNMIQSHRIEILRQHQNFVENMPVPYTKARVIYDNQDNVVNIKYTVSNGAFRELLNENSQPDTPYLIFPSEFIAEKTKLLLECHSAVSFIYHFDSSEKYYIFTLCLVGKEKKAKQMKNEYTNEIDIFAIDITSRQRTQIELKAATQRLDMTLSVAKVVPWEWDIARDVLIIDAQSLFKNLGYMLNGSTERPSQQKCEIPISEYVQLLSPDDRTKLLSIRERLQIGKLNNFHIEFRLYIPRDGKVIEEWVDVNGSVSIRNKDGGARKVIGSLIFITERKNQELDLIEAKEKANESDKLKSAFLANMSHEIRTPLNAIVGFAGLLCETEDPKKRREFVDIIMQNNDMLLNLINDVLDLAKIESNTIDISYSVVDLNQLFNTISHTIQSRVPKGVMLNMVVGLPECHIWADGNRLSQVILNLLTNAAKFTPKGSITFGYDIESDGNMHFYVKDTGIGIAKENQGRLFQRFDKLNNFKQGTGLGLSISKSLVEKMGGTIGMQSRGEGKGCTFWFDLPYRQVDEADLKDSRKSVDDNKDEVFKNKSVTVDGLGPNPTDVETTSEHLKTAEQSIHDGDASKPLILVAEDMEGNFQLVENLISKKYSIIHAWNGEEAITMLKKYNPKLILMDINMPTMNGFEATAEIRKFNKLIPIVAVTAYAYASDRKRILSSGFNDYLSKPITRDDLMEAINRHMQ